MSSHIIINNNFIKNYKNITFNNNDINELIKLVIQNYYHNSNKNLYENELHSCNYTIIHKKEIT